MKLHAAIAVAGVALVPVAGFNMLPVAPHASSCSACGWRRTSAAPRQSWALRVSEAVEPAVEAGDIASPADLASDCGIDYIPLATMLATGDLKSADQFTRDALIRAAGEGSRKRGFVYWTDVKNIPSTDLRTIERLWLKNSKGKFGYSVQRDVWLRSKGDFETFCRRIGWNTKNAEVERKLRWFGANEFTYDVDKAPRGHLPLTSALRGTTLLRQLLTHPLWESEEWKSGGK